MQTAYTSEEYLIGWALYLGGALVVFICWWFLTAGLRKAELRHILRTGAFAFLFTPWFASPEMPYLAPAWVITILEGFFDGGNAFLRAGIPLLGSIVLFLSASLIIKLVVRRA